METVCECLVGYSKGPSYHHFRQFLHRVLAVRLFLSFLVQSRRKYHRYRGHHIRLRTRKCSSNDAIVRVGKERAASTITSSASLHDERPFTQAMIKSLVSFVEGKAASVSMSVPVFTFAALRLANSVAEDADGDAPSSIPGARKKIGSLLVPVEDGAFSFDEAWTWKLNRKRPTMSEGAKKEIKDMVRALAFTNAVC